MATTLKGSLPERIAQIPPIEKYRNSTTLATIAGVPLQLEDVMKACLISRSNIFLTGGRGEGKTDLTSDIFYRYFGGRGIFVECEPDLSVKELFSRLNLGKLQLAGKTELTSDDIHEIREALHTHIIVVDELTRAPPLTQNQLFAFANGMFRFRGKEYPIGDGYSVMLASANVGAKHAGTFQVPDALLDRMNVIVDLNHFEITPEDFSHIISRDHDPRVHAYQALNGTGCKWDEEFVEMYKMFNEIEAPTEMKVIAMYVRFVLNWCAQKSIEKKKIEAAIPHQVCKGCNQLGAGCGYIKAPSTRYVKNLVRMTLAFQQVAEAKAITEQITVQKNYVADVIETFKLITPPLGIFDPQFVLQNHYGNPYLFASQVAQGIDQKINAKSDALAQAFSEVSKGVISAKTAKEFSGEWAPIGEFFKSAAKAVAEQ